MTATIVRIVIDGSPQVWCRGNAISPNFDMARQMLRQAVDDHRWPLSRVLFSVTPGGFLQGRMPPEYGGLAGWHSRPCDFRSLIPTAEKAIWEVLDKDTCAKLRERAHFLTVGVDLVPEGESKKGGGTGTRAELVAVVDLDERVVVRWTGRSYPESGQEERVLVREPCLKSHMLCMARQRLLVLGCHDLNMFSARAQDRAKGKRHQCWREMVDISCRFGPTMAFHHPHQTDDVRTWKQGWTGLLQCAQKNATYASGIAYFPDLPRHHKARHPLEDVLRSTKSGDDVVDICVNGFWSKEWKRY